jgi:hypothetical protein
MQGDTLTRLAILNGDIAPLPHPQTYFRIMGSQPPIASGFCQFSTEHS